MDRELPKVAAVDVVAAQPKPADMEKMEFSKREADEAIEPMTYIVKIELTDSPLLFSGYGISLFVGDYYVEKYAGYKGGIYFKVYDPRFFEIHEGEEIRLSADGETFVNTGVTLPRLVSNEVALADAASQLPTQEEILK